MTRCTMALQVAVFPCFAVYFLGLVTGTEMTLPGLQAFGSKDTGERQQLTAPLKPSPIEMLQRVRASDAPDDADVNTLLTL